MGYFNTFKKIIDREVGKQRFKSAWRRKNAHNFTIALNTFPIENVEVGNYTYGGLNVKTYGGANEILKIGHFVSIGIDSKFILGGNHPADTLSTYPFQQKIFNKETLSFSKGPITIDDDVWIGENVIIFSGVSIGQGAIVGTGSVVTKNVEPYSLVAGNPAVMKKHRFAKEIIDELLKIDYSKLSKKVIEENLDLLSHKKIVDLDSVKLFQQKIKNG